MFYGVLSTGYKDGGFDQFYLGSHRLVDPQQASLEFKEETVDAAEIGMKSTLLDGAMTLNIAAFRSEYDNLQTSALVGSTFVVSNAGKAITQGVEMDMRYALTTDLTLGAGLSWLDAYYDEFENAACTVRQQYEARLANINPCVQDLSGAPLQYAPDWSGNFNAAWAHPITDSLEIRVRGELFYSDSFYTAQDEDPYTEADSFTKINLRIGLAQLDGAWEVALIGKNITDEDTTSWINDVSNSNAPAPLPPALSETYFARTDRGRTIALQGIYRF
jgi:iron complex outermembrane receptor protein